MQVTEAKLDTDNIKLRQLRDASELAIAMELEALLVTGTCIDFAATKHAELYPRGTQLTLGSPGGPAREDTVVMSNLGYFQLKAKPGVLARPSSLLVLVSRSPLSPSA